MKKLICLLISIILMVSLCACGATEVDTKKVSDVKNKVEKSNSIEFADSLLEQYIRVALGKLQGEITQDDIDTITKLQFHAFGYIAYSTRDWELEDSEDSSEMIGDMYEPLPTLVRAEDSEYKTKYEKESTFPISLEDLEKFTKLQALEISKDDIKNYNYLSKLTNLKYLYLLTYDCVFDCELIKDSSIEYLELSVEEDALLNQEALLNISTLKKVVMYDAELRPEIESKLKSKGVEVVQ